MSIGSITSSAAAGKAAWVSQVQQQSGGGGAGALHRPPPPPDGGALVGAVADALQSIGVTATGTADDGSAAAGTDTAPQGNAAHALGSFLHELMGALHQQGAAQGGGQGGQPPDDQAYGPPGGGPGGPGGAGGAGGPPGGPGRLAADLQGLISRLGTSASDSADSNAAATATDSASSPLESAFAHLLQALGSDSAGAGGKLSSFLQTLADKLPGAGSSGNLINTSV